MVLLVGAVIIVPCRRFTGGISRGSAQGGAVGEPVSAIQRLGIFLVLSVARTPLRKRFRCFAAVVGFHTYVEAEISKLEEA